MLLFLHLFCAFYFNETPIQMKPSHCKAGCFKINEGHLKPVLLNYQSYVVKVIDLK